MKLMGKYAVHELRYPGDEMLAFIPRSTNEPHANELMGRDIWCDSSGLWKDFGINPEIRVHAGPIKHRSVSFSSSIHGDD